MQGGGKAVVAEDFGGNLGRDAVDAYEGGEGAGDPYAAPRRWNNL
ncbi:MAG TPA: hypothetical protein VHM69_14920 [Rubrobacter sp.]|nr:hypothetical protein [Rubrobacter sp.]